MGRAIDVEKLLQWAFREELPKGRPVSASAWDAIASYGTLGTRIDVGHHGGHDGLGFVAGTPHPDAEIIGAVVGQLDLETRLSEDECFALIGAYAHLDPLAVKAIAVRAPFSMRALIIRCAVLGDAMTWNIGLPVPTPALRHDKQRWAAAFVMDAESGALIEAKANGRGNYPEGAATHVAWHEPSIGQLLEARAEYAVWHRAMVLVAATLEGQMREHGALPPLRPAEPWITGEPKPGVVHRETSPPCVAKLLLTPTRPTALPRLRGRARNEVALCRG